MPNGWTLCFVDTNILVYAKTSNEPAKQRIASAWLDRLAARDQISISPQSIAEFYRASLRMFPNVGPGERRRVAMSLVRWMSAPLDPASIARAFKVEDETGYQWFDCMLLGSALEAGCGVFLTEDLQDGRVVQGLRIVNPLLMSPDAAIEF